MEVILIKVTKMGRPPIDNPKSNRFSIRIDNETLEILNKYCKEKGLSKGEVIRQALLMFLGETPK